MEPDEKQQAQINRELNKSEALHLMTKLTELVDRVVRFNLSHPVDGYDAWLASTRRIRASLFYTIESIEDAQDLTARWKEPKTSEVHLLNGQIINTEINGKTLDGSSGYILIGEKDVNVDLIDGCWQESKRGKGWK